MLPSWMIEEMARERREREALEERERARLRIDAPVPGEPREGSEREPRGAVVVWNEVADRSGSAREASRRPPAAAAIAQVIVCRPEAPAALMGLAPFRRERAERSPHLGAEVTP